MKKILVIGSPGSGKSTFSRKLRDATNLPLHHLDLIWHKPDRTTISKDELDAEIRSIISSEEWIIDGNYRRTLEMRLAACDTVFLFNLPVEICLDGVRARIGTKREDMPWVENEFDKEFMEWIINFPQNNLPMIMELLDKYGKERNVTVFSSRDEADKYIEKLKGVQ